MNNKHLFIACVSILVMLAIGYTWLNTDKGTADGHELASQTVEHNGDAENANPEISTTAEGEENKTDSKAPDNDQVDAFAAQFDERRYSDQLQVELASVSMDMMTCDKGRLGHSAYDEHEAEEKVNRLRQILGEKCAQLREKYPLLESGGTGMKTQFFKYHIQGGLVEVLQKFTVVRNAEEIAPAFRETIQDIQRRKNGQMLNMALMMSEMNPVLLANERALLGGIDRYYLKEIQAITLTRISCAFQQGETCASTGLFMLRQCAETRDACGMDFEAWYEHYTTDAMRADIELLMNFYRG